MRTASAVIATVALIVSTKASTVDDVEEYSNDALKRINRDLNMVDGVGKADLINPNIHTRFHLSDDPLDDGFLLEADSGIDYVRSVDHDVCGHWLGINLGEGRKYFCNITLLTADVDDFFENENRAEVMFFLAFESDIPRAESIVLRVPVLRIPPSKSFLSPKELKEWADGECVGLVSPLSEEQITQLRETNQISQLITLKLNFAWLHELLQFEIIKSNGDYHIKKDSPIRPLYATRPVLLSDAVVEKLMDAVDWLKLDEGSDDTDDLSACRNLADRHSQRFGDLEFEEIQ